MTIAAIGTTTTVCNDEVVGFGHPATYNGHVTAALQPADAVYIQEDPAWAPYKVANVAPPVGTISEDHRTGVTGAIGAVPDAFTVSSTATFGTRTRTGSTQVYMQDYAPNATLYQIYLNQDRVVDQYLPGSEESSWTIVGTKADGSEFTVDLGDRYRSTYDITDYAIWDVPDMVYILSQLEGVSIESVSYDGVVSDSTTEWKVKGMEVKVGGSWVPVKANGKVTAKAGATLKVRALLTSTAGATKTVPVSVPIPAKLAGGDGRLRLIGGGRPLHRLLVGRHHRRVPGHRGRLPPQRPGRRGARRRRQGRERRAQHRLEPAGHGGRGSQDLPSHREVTA